MSWEEQSPTGRVTALNENDRKLRDTVNESVFEILLILLGRLYTNEGLASANWNKRKLPL